ncbi:MAG: hypothetical protein J6A77_06935 [Lachnospiraceae bacterium]|nr:hypothetical protein [Lachnospiraceae bacterium]
MSEIKFVTVKDLEKEEYQGFSLLTEYEKDHPFHMLYEYIVQFYGGLREDVLYFLSNGKKLNQLNQCIGSIQEPGIRNEWYRRLVRLLQCNAEAEWYELYCMEDAGKTEGYRQYFLNQLAGYAEQGIEAGKVREIYQECDAAYLLEYKIRCVVKKVMTEDESEIEIKEQAEDIAGELSQDVMLQEQTESEQTDILQTLLENQKTIQGLLERMLSTPVRNDREEVYQRTEEMEISTEAEQKVEECSTDTKEKVEETVSEERKDEFSIAEAAVEHKEKAFRIAHLFQQIRLKRKSVQLRKMDSTLQLQELVLLMRKKLFSSEDIAVVRKMLDLEVSLEFLYSLINEEKEPVKQLQQMYEFMTYQPESAEE